MDKKPTKFLPSPRKSPKTFFRKKIGGRKSYKEGEIEKKLSDQICRESKITSCR